MEHAHGREGNEKVNLLVGNLDSLLDLNWSTPFCDDIKMIGFDVKVPIRFAGGRAELNAIGIGAAA